MPDRLEDMGWTAAEASAMRKIDPAVSDRVLNALHSSWPGDWYDDDEENEE